MVLRHLKSVYLMRLSISIVQIDKKRGGYLTPGPLSLLKLLASNKAAVKFK